MKSTLIKHSLALYLLVIIGTLSGQEQMTLEKAIALGLENNFQLKVSDRSILIAENNNTWARAGRGPIIDLNGQFNNNLVNDNNPASFLQGTYYSGTAGVSADLQWVILSGGRIKVAKDQFETIVDQEKLQKEVAIHDLLLQIYQDYYAVLFAQERREVLVSNLRLSRDRYDYEQTKKAYGATNSYNLIQFENAIIADSIALVNQLQAIDVAKRQLYNTLDLEGLQEYIFRDRLSVSDEGVDVARLKDVLSEENYTLKTLEIIASLSNLNTKLQESAQRPTLSFTTSIGANRNGFKFFADDPDTGDPFPFFQSNRFNGNVGLQANYNLYDGGVRSADVQNARIEEDIAQMNILEARTELNNQLDILVENYELQRRQVLLSDDQIQIAQRNLQMTEERFKAGLISSIDFRNVQVQFINAAFNKINAIYNLILAKSEIDYLVGSFN